MTHTPAKGHAVGDDGVRRSLALAAFVPGWAALTVVLLGTIAGVSIPVAQRYWLLLATAAVLGLPHGAFDHLTVPRGRGAALTPEWLGQFGVGYLVGGAGFVAVWHVVPALAFLLFLALTWFHWGQGDRFPLARLAGADHLRDRWVRYGTTVVRGGIPMVVPLLAFPSLYRAVADTVLALFGAGGSLDWIVRTDLRLALGFGLAAVTVVTLARGWQVAGTTTGWRVDVAETALLWMTFAVVPPLVAIAAYFAGWHSVRHLVRLLTIDEGSMTVLGDRAVGRERSRGGWLRVAWRLCRDGAPATLGAVLLVAGLWAVTPGATLSTPSLAGTYLVGLAALTVPHTVVVTWLDHVQDV